MKKTSRKLFAAVASLGLAVAATVGSTYAWFSMNDTVTANGMNVKVQGESTLLIDKSNTVTNGRLAHGSSSATLETPASDVKEIKPTSTVDLANWFYATAEEADATTAKTGSYKAIEQGNVSQHVAEYTFYLQVFDKTQAGEATDMVVAGKKKDIELDVVTLSAKDSTNLAKSLRVGVKQDSTKYFVAPLYAGTDNPANQGVSSVTDGAATKGNVSWTAKTTANDGLTCDINAGAAKLVEGVKYNKVYTVSVYVYFDGEDADCFTDNIPETLAEYGLTLKFTLVDGANAA